MKTHRARFIVVGAIVGMAAVGACSLNPQPIPPGEQPDAASKFGAGGGDGGNSVPTIGEDGGAGLAEDAGDATPGEEDASDAGEDADTDAD